MSPLIVWTTQTTTLDSKVTQAGKNRRRRILKNDFERIFISNFLFCTHYNYCVTDVKDLLPSMDAQKEVGGRWGKQTILKNNYIRSANKTQIRVSFELFTTSPTKNFGKKHQVPRPLEFQSMCICFSTSNFLKSLHKQIVKVNLSKVQNYPSELIKSINNDL